MKDRLKSVRLQYRTKDGSKPTQEKFAEEMGISKAAVVAYETGNRKPTSSAVQLICERCGVNYDWLMNGEGVPYKELTKEEEIAKFLGVVANAPEESSMKRFAHLLARLPEDLWDVIDQKLLEIEKEKKERSKE